MTFLAAFAAGNALPGVDLPGNLLKGEIFLPGGYGLGLAQLHPRILVGLADGAAAQNIVELIEQQVLPALAQGTGPVAGEGGGERTEFFAAGQGAFRFAVQGLNQRSGGIAAAGVVLQLLFPDGQACAFRGQSVKIRVRVGEDHLVAVLAGGLIGLDGAQVANGGAAAVIAHAVEGHDGMPRRFLHVQSVLNALGHVAEAGGVAVDAEGSHLRAVRRFPHKGGEGNFAVFAHFRPLHDVMIYTGVAEKHGQGGGVAEGIHIIAGFHGYAEFLAEIALAQKQLPGEGFAGGHVAIGLNPHAAHDFPAALAHPFLNFPEHVRIDFLHPLVITGAGGGKDEIGRFPDAVQGGTEGGQNLLHTLLPMPEPDGVDMGVADHMNHK